MRVPLANARQAPSNGYAKTLGVELRRVASPPIEDPTQADSVESRIQTISLLCDRYCHCRSYGPIPLPPSPATIEAQLWLDRVVFE